MKALRQLEYAKDLQICEVPIPEADAGSVVIRVLVTSIISYAKNVYNGVLKYPYQTPLTTGAMAIGRVHTFGPDCTNLEKGRLVFFDMTVRARGDSSHIFLSAVSEGGTEGSRKLMSYWRNGSNAEYMKCPLENIFPLSENLLKPVSEGGHGYTVEDLIYIGKALVPYGGLADIGLRVGETIVMAPTTGGFGGAGVRVALSMGARVIALGRNVKVLSQLKESLSSYGNRLITVPIAGDVGEQLAAVKEAAGSTPIDCFFDISPTNAANAPYFKACILSLRHSGRVSLMGGQHVDVAIPLRWVMRGNLSLRGKWMYERQDVIDFIRMVEAGSILLGERGGIGAATAFKLEDWTEALDFAEEHGNAGGEVVFRIGI